MKLLEIQHLSMWMKDENDEKQILDDITFSMEAKESVALVGMSGSGKSQLMRTMLQLQRSNSRTKGSILWKGEDICTWNERKMQKIRYHEIAMMMQDPKMALDPLFTIGYQMRECFSSLTKQEAEQQSLALLEQVKITAPKRILKAYPHELSIGMCQRIWMAMLLASDAKLWITDEATSALDVSVQAEILVLLKELQTIKECALIFITHDLRLVPSMCDRVIVMKDGHIHQECEVKALYQQKDPYTKSLLGWER